MRDETCVQIHNGHCVSHLARPPFPVPSFSVPITTSILIISCLENSLTTYFSVYTFVKFLFYLTFLCRVIISQCLEGGCNNHLPHSSTFLICPLAHSLSFSPLSISPSSLLVTPICRNSLEHLLDNIYLTTSSEAETNNAQQIFKHSVPHHLRSANVHLTRVAISDAEPTLSELVAEIMDVSTSHSGMFPLELKHW